MTESIDQGGSAPGHAARIHHEDHGKPQPFRHFGAASRLGEAVIAIKEPHDPLDDCDVGLLKEAQKQPPVIIQAKHPPVQISGRHPGDLRMKSGIDEIGTNLERLDAHPPRFEGGHQRQRERGLAAPAMRPPNKKCKFPYHLTHPVPVIGH